jgi:hypothetical protein
MAEALQSTTLGHKQTRSAPPTRRRPTSARSSAPPSPTLVQPSCLRSSPAADRTNVDKAAFVARLLPLPPPFLNCCSQKRATHHLIVKGHLLIGPVRNAFSFRWPTWSLFLSWTAGCLAVVSDGPLGHARRVPSSSTFNTAIQMVEMQLPSLLLAQISSK